MDSRAISFDLHAKEKRVFTFCHFAMKKESVESREFVEVADWELFQYSETRKVPDPPWRWFKVQVSFVRSPFWLNLTKTQRGDFISMLAIASECGNFIPYDAKWLSLRLISVKVLNALIKAGLVRKFSVPADDKRIKALRGIFSGVTPEELRRNSGLEERRGDKKRGEENIHTAAASPDADAQAFETFKEAYPKRAGGQRWLAAQKAINARFLENKSLTWADVTDGAARYAAYCDAAEITGTQFVKQAATFVGPEKHFLEKWDLPPAKLTYAEKLAQDSEQLGQNEPQKLIGHVANE